MTWLR